MDHLEGWEYVWHVCLRRIRERGTPRGQERAAWLDEARSAGLAAYGQAVHDFDPGRGLSWFEFTVRRVLDAVWTCYRREDKRGRHFVGALGSEPPARPDGAAEAREDVEQLEVWLAALPEDQGQILRMYYLEGRTKAEIAHELGIHPETVKRRIDKALNDLRREAGADGENS